MRIRSTKEIAKSEGLEFGGWGNLLNPFKKGGFGATYSKEDGPSMTFDDLSKTGQVMDWSKSYMGDDSFKFDDAADISMSDNPTQSLLGRYNKYNQDQKMAGPKEQFKTSDMDGRDGYEQYLLDEQSNQPPITEQEPPIIEETTESFVPSASSSEGHSTNKGVANPGKLAFMWQNGEIDKDEYAHYMKEWTSRNPKGGS